VNAGRRSFPATPRCAGFAPHGSCRRWRPPCCAALLARHPVQRPWSGATGSLAAILDALAACVWRCSNPADPGHRGLPQVPPPLAQGPRGRPPARRLLRGRARRHAGWPRAHRQARGAQQQQRRQWRRRRRLGKGAAPRGMDARHRAPTEPHKRHEQACMWDARPSPLDNLRRASSDNWVEPLHSRRPPRRAVAGQPRPCCAHAPSARRRRRRWRKLPWRWQRPCWRTRTPQTPRCAAAAPRSWPRPAASGATRSRCSRY
jgi:hypothetical protein